MKYLIIKKLRTLCRSTVTFRKHGPNWGRRIKEVLQMAGGHGKIVHFTSNQRNIVSKQWDVTVHF